MDKCISCGSSAIRSVGKIPPIDNFAGTVLVKPLKGGVLYECKNCHLFFRYPRLAKKVMEELYSQTAEDNWSSGDEDRKDWEIAAEWINQLPSGSSVLDVGCFNGQFLELLGSSYDRFGVEINHKACQQAEEKGVKIIGNKIDDFEIPAKKLDIVIAMDVIEHIEDPLKFLNFLAKTICDGGKIIISTGNTEAWAWKLMGSKYYYCNTGEHISFINNKWLDRSTKHLNMKIIQKVRFAHNNFGCIRRINDLGKNLLYKFSPYIAACLRKKGFGKTDTSYHEELAYIPPTWWSAKDHFICLIEK